MGGINELSNLVGLSGPLHWQKWAPVKGQVFLLDEVSGNSPLAVFILHGSDGF